MLALARRRRTLGAAIAVGLCGATAGPAHGASLCVADRSGCYRSLQKAVDAARDGDSIRLGPGVYRGGVTIDVSVELRGAGASATRIRGGGPVLTLGAPFAPDPPTVAISGVTISDGVTTSTIIDGARRPYHAWGGGVLIPPSQDFSPGATVAITDSVIERNAVAPSATVPSPGGKQCPDGPCPFAAGYGGGIYNAGELTLTRTIVAHNRNGTRPGAAPLASDAEGGGIYSAGLLTLTDSQVAGNEALALPPNGRYANGGGVFSLSGGVKVRHSTISDNRARIASSWPASVEQGNIGGGLFVDGESQATVERSRIERNELRAFNTVGDAIAFSGGVHGNGPVAISDSRVGSNHVTARVPAESAGQASADSGAGNLNARSTITRSRLVGNTATAVGGTGPAIAAAGALWGWSDDTIDVRGSVISGNRVTATGDGSVTAHGGGIVNVDALALTGTDVSRNAIRAFGHSGEALGGGIWNSREPDFALHLSLTDSAITGNSIAASAAIAVHGGGVFTTDPITQTRTHIRGNRPDECVGC